LTVSSTAGSFKDDYRQDSAETIRQRLSLARREVEKREALLRERITVTKTTLAEYIALLASEYGMSDKELEEEYRKVHQAVWGSSVE
jgi:hypothetical protein